MAKNILRNKYYELAFSLILILNIFLLLYFIAKLTQIENLSRETQAQAQELLENLKEQNQNNNY